jgi:F-type H+-transporting ATPase subunit gamma
MAPFEMSQSSPNQMSQKKKHAMRLAAAVALGAAVGTIGFLALDKHTVVSQQANIQLNLGCVKDHIGINGRTWTPSGILDPESDMIADCQVKNSGHVLGKGFMTAPMPMRSSAVARTARTVPVEMAVIAELRSRVASVKNTQKITSAMKLVAAAKVRRAQEAVIRSRPFSESLEGILGGLLKRAKLEAPDIPLLANRPVKKVALVVLSGDRGLCGAYNSAVIKKAEKRIAELKGQGVDVELFTIGNKAGAWFGKRDTPIMESMPIGQAPSAEASSKIADGLLSSYYGGDVDRVELIYTTFISMISSVPTIRTLVPLLPNGMEMEDDEILKITTKDGDLSIEKETVPVAKPKEFVSDMIYEQEPKVLLDSILKLYLNGQILRTLQESVASELASRMSAMQSATDNAKELQGQLTTEMNRARQAKITQELMEIIAGANAV